MRYWQLPLFLLVLTLPQQRLMAVDGMGFSAARVIGDGWDASNLHLVIHLSPDNSPKLDIQSSMLRLASTDQAIEDIHWQCEQLEQVDTEYACKQSQLIVGKSPWGAARLILDWRYTDSENWHIILHRLNAGIGELKGSLSMTEGAWRGQVSGQQLQLNELYKLIPKAVTAADWSFSGAVSFTAEFAGTQEKLQRLLLNLNGQQVAYGDAEGLQAGEDVALGLNLGAEAKNGWWTGVLDLSVEQGQLYSDPVYLSVDEGPLSLHAQFEGEPGQLRLQIDDARLKLPGVANASIKGHMEKWQWKAMEILFEAPDLAGFYKVLAQPYLIGTALDELSVKGSGEGHLKLREVELVALDMQLHQVDMEDGQGRFGVQQLNTDLHWLAQGRASASELSLTGGHLFNIDFGKMQAKVQVNDGQLQVEDKISMPLLGGELILNNLQLDGLSKPPVKWQLALSARQIQLGALSKSLNWPTLSGQLDGHVPNVQYDDGKMVLDGELIVDVFGGRIMVDGLQIIGPMDVAPVLETQLRLQDLDLAQLTSTFSFGRIDGLLAGQIDELQLVGWELNRFKAGIRTPQHDKSRHRISQRAIDNLTSLGTGMSAGLSGTALRVFKDFAYDKIALEVDLTGDMASLDGIPHKDGGYYIVKGAGLPRIDVIGHTREIAWKDLMSRIQDARFDDMVIE
jgi:hypothetical protein